MRIFCGEKILSFLKKKKKRAAAGALIQFPFPTKQFRHGEGRGGEKGANTTDAFFFVASVRRFCSRLLLLFVGISLFCACVKCMSSHTSHDQPVPFLFPVSLLIPLFPPSPRITSFSSLPLSRLPSTVPRFRFSKYCPSPPPPLLREEKMGGAEEKTVIFARKKF